MASPQDAVKKLNGAFGKIDENTFEVVDIAENFFGEYIVTLRTRRTVKATYLTLKRIAEITEAKDILVEKCDGDNLVEIKLMLSKR